jgi:GTP pyrophosphokinase
MPLSKRFDQALEFAAELHRDQCRKGTTIPYVAHLLAVTALVLEHGGDEDEAIAALLHDAIEDQGGDATRQEIRRRFGDRVVDIVEGCTDTDKVPKPPWRERKEKYLAHLLSASPSVRLVTAADKLHNARSLLEDYRELGESIWDRFNGGKEGTLWYLRSVVGELNAAGPTPLVRELERVVTELERLTASRNGVAAC